MGWLLELVLLYGFSLEYKCINWSRTEYIYVKKIKLICYYNHFSS